MAEDGHTRGRPSSWVAVTIILAGFVLGGIALIVGQWWMFWVAVALVVAGGIVAVVTDIFSDVELDPILPGEEHVSPIKGEVTSVAPGGAAAMTRPEVSAADEDGTDTATATASSGGEGSDTAEGGRHG